jgi:hypothetical protein
MSAGSEPVSRWGTVEIQNAEGISSSTANSGGVRRNITQSRYTWRPPRDLAAELPSGFSLVFLCFACEGGVRRFVPFKFTEAFIHEAALGGLTLLTREHQLTSEHQFSYGYYRMLFRKSANLREHLDRKFARYSELCITTSGRTQGDSHVLPEDLGLDVNGRGTPWSPAILMARGREEARNIGETDTSSAKLIRLGLLVAAERNPIDTDTLSEVSSLALIRQAFFDFGPVQGPLDEGIIEKVRARLSAALERHHDLDSKAFSHWFYEATDNLVHAVAKQKKHGGRLSREMVRQALLDEVFRSFIYVGDCVHFQMTAFARALDPPLDAEERAQFELVYRKQCFLGGLPLVLLLDRFEFLRESMINMWENPHDTSRIGVLLRLLAFYGEMVTKRRAADRSLKNPSGEKVGFIPDSIPAPKSDQDSASGDFQTIATVFRESRRASCRCRTTRDWRASLVVDDAHPELVRIDDTCGTCGVSEGIELSRADFERAGREILEYSTPGEE